MDDDIARRQRFRAETIASQLSGGRPASTALVASMLRLVEADERPGEPESSGSSGPAAGARQILQRPPQAVQEQLW